jgi:hypothetical protein
MLDYMGYYLVTGVVLSLYTGDGITDFNAKTLATIVAWPIVLSILVVKGLVTLIKE